MKITAEVVAGFSNSCLRKNFDGPTETPHFHLDWWELVCSNRKFVAIAAPRRHAKSTAVTHAYTLAAVLFRERSYVLVVSDTYSQACQFLGDIKRELVNNEDIIDLFNIEGLDKDTEDDIIVKCRDGHQFRLQARGSGQNLRGLKWSNKRPDLIVCHEEGTEIYTPETGWIKNQDYPNAVKIHSHEAFEIEFEDGTKEIVSGEHRYLTDRGWVFAWMLKPNENVVENITDDIMNDILKNEKNPWRNTTIRQRLKNGVQNGLRTILLSMLLLNTTGPETILQKLKKILKSIARNILAGWLHNVQNVVVKN